MGKIQVVFNQKSVFDFSTYFGLCGAANRDKKKIHPQAKKSWKKVNKRPNIDLMKFVHLFWLKEVKRNIKSCKTGVIGPNPFPLGPIEKKWILF